VKVYVASSWRNKFQPQVVQTLRANGHTVYDFKDSDGFHWSEVDPNWKDWTNTLYIRGLDHHCAERGFERDMAALRDCEACVYVMPCGVSASLEAGWAAGNGKLLIVYVPDLKEPDLMVKMADFVTCDLSEVVERLKL
jgi:hypothetical protein